MVAYSPPMRRILQRHWTQSLSCIERWADDLHMPRALNFFREESTDEVTLSAELPEVEQLQAEIRREKVIVLSTTRGTTTSEHEYYNEISIPAGMGRATVLLEYAEGLLTLRFLRGNWLTRIRARYLA